MIALLACRACGSGPTDYSGPQRVFFKDLSGPCYIRCPSCHSSTDEYATEETAVFAWNRLNRVSDVDPCPPLHQAQNWFMHSLTLEQRRQFLVVWLPMDRFAVEALTTEMQFVALRHFHQRYRAALASVGRSGNRQDRETGLGPKDEHAVAATSGETPTPGMQGKRPRIPTPEMIAAAWAVIERDKKATGVAKLGPGLGVREIWQAMYDAASEPPAQPENDQCQD